MRQQIKKDNLLIFFSMRSIDRFIKNILYRVTMRVSENVKDMQGRDLITKPHMHYTFNTFNINHDSAKSEHHF